MSQILIVINGREYSIVCDDGQEAHLSRLAEYLDRRVTELADAVGQVGDSRLLVMAGLLVADELSDAYAEIAELRQGRQGDLLTNVDDGAGAARREQQAAVALDTLSARIEAIAARLEQT